MAELRDVQGNPIPVTDEFDNPVTFTDKHGNPVRVTGVVTTENAAGDLRRSGSSSSSSSVC